MKFLFCCLIITQSFHSQAQKITSDTIPDLTTKELHLSGQQEIAIKKLIWEYNNDERKRRRILRHRIFMILNRDQQILVRRWWRSQIIQVKKGY